jgi:hypothetical protein
VYPDLICTVALKNPTDLVLYSSRNLVPMCLPQMLGAGVMGSCGARNNETSGKVVF